MSILQKFKSGTDTNKVKTFKKFSPLGDMSVYQFLSEYWQKRPLLIRQGFPRFSTPINPDELAGLACENEVESRLVLEKDGPSPWSLERGPFTEQRFESLPDSHWTLLVQEANRYVPDLAALLNAFNFIPNWRIDDVMVSYAPVHGSVGPHVDQYDVFLLQGLGRRRWKINTAVVELDNFREDTELKIMKEFEAEEEWILKPGDILYLPPGVAHYGIAMEECMTFSIGFRTPANAELIGGFVDDLLPKLNDLQRYEDKDLQIQDNPGEISAQALKQIQTIIHQATSNKQQVNRWFGRYITEPKHGDVPEDRSEFISTDEFKRQLSKAGILVRSEYSRFSFINEKNHVLLYIDGEEYELPTHWTYLVQLICNHRILKEELLTPYLDDDAFIDLFCALYNHSKYDFADEAWEHLR